MHNILGASALTLNTVLFSGCVTNSLRIVGGTNALTGRVEICSANSWGTVCDDSFNNNAARVVCRQLGYSNGTARKHMITIIIYS